MQTQSLIFILINLTCLLAWTEPLPNWITKGPMSDSTYHYVICSHDGIDPEEARQVAESKCLASAAKLGGVNVKLTQKTVQSLTGVDSSEVAEIQPIQAKVQCDWTDRFLEKIKDGYRVWLKCKVKKISFATSKSYADKNDILVPKSLVHGDATLIISTVPKADQLIVMGEGGERVIEPTSNTINIAISTLDTKVRVFKIGYKPYLIEIPKDLKQGSKVQKTVVLESE